MSSDYEVIDDASSTTSDVVEEAIASLRRTQASVCRRAAKVVYQLAKKKNKAHA